MPSVKVQLLLTGNELMSGDIVDSNSAMIAQNLKDIGIELKRKTTVSDDLTLLVNEIRSLSTEADIVIINGGLGPTIDDLTAKALAEAAGLALEEHPEALKHLQYWCHKRKNLLSKQNLKQAILPSGCEIVPNNAGSAVGFKLSINKCLFICTPGVPSELKVMLEEEVIPLLTLLDRGDNKIHVSRFQVFGIGESKLQAMVDENITDWPECIELGFRANHEYLEVKLTTRNSDAKQRKEKYLAALVALLGDHIFHNIEKKPITLEESVISLLKSHRLQLTTAESCTGGLIASKLTSIPGSSTVFEAGFVTYSNEIKTKMLNVSPATLTEKGAVSIECVHEMAAGALKLANSNLVVAVSGIAGPSGETKTKPVGTVCFSWGRSNKINTTQLLLGGDRLAVQKTSALIGLDLIRRFLIDSNETPLYITEKQTN